MFTERANKMKTRVWCGKFLFLCESIREMGLLEHIPAMVPLTNQPIVERNLHTGEDTTTKYSSHFRMP